MFIQCWYYFWLIFIVAWNRRVTFDRVEQYHDIDFFGLPKKKRITIFKLVLSFWTGAICILRWRLLSVCSTWRHLFVLRFGFVQSRKEITFGQGQAFQRMRTIYMRHANHSLFVPWFCLISRAFSDSFQLNICFVWNWRNINIEIYATNPSETKEKAGVRLWLEPRIYEFLWSKCCELNSAPFPRSFRANFMIFRTKKKKIIE